MIELQSSDNLLNIILMDDLTGCGINGHKLFEKLIDSAFCLSHGFEGFPVAVGKLFGEIYIIEKCLYIEAGTAYHDRNLSAGIYILCGLIGKILKDGYVERLGRLKYIYKMMSYAMHFRFGDLSRTDIHASVYLHRIGGDYLSAYLLCQSD